jgi:hypothetical protein
LTGNLKDFEIPIEERFSTADFNKRGERRRKRDVGDEQNLLISTVDHL